MNAAVAQQLIALNQQFYLSLAAPFSVTRGRLQSGVLRVLQGVPDDADVLDLGCGNGGVAAELARRGHRGRYVGLDFSAEMLAIAKSRVESSRFNFIHADLTESFIQRSAISDQQFDFVFAFAALHHIPSHELRLYFLRQVRESLAASAHFVHSNWQFMNSPKLRERVQPWDSAGLQATNVDEGDYLLDWRSGGSGLRYVHHFSEVELKALAAAAGFKVTESFLSDGKGGKLALYQTWDSMQLS